MVDQSTRARWESVEQRLADNWVTTRLAVIGHVRTAWVAAGAGLLLGATVLLSTIWFPGFWVQFLLGLALLACLMTGLVLNARAVHLQTGEDAAYIHLLTTLPILLCIMVPVVGAVVSFLVGTRSIVGRYNRSGESSQPKHRVGRTSRPLGILLIAISVSQVLWLLAVLRTL